MVGPMAMRPHSMAQDFIAVRWLKPNLFMHWFLPRRKESAEGTSGGAMVERVACTLGNRGRALEQEGQSSYDGEVRARPPPPVARLGRRSDL